MYVCVAILSVKFTFFLSAHGPYCDSLAGTLEYIPCAMVAYLPINRSPSDRYQSKTRPICLIAPYLGPTTPHPFITHHIQHVKKEKMELRRHAPVWYPQEPLRLPEKLKRTGTLGSLPVSISQAEIFYAKSFYHPPGRVSTVH